MNLVEEFNLRNEGIIIFISGLSGTNRTILAKEIERDLKLKLISLDDYCNNNPPIIEILDQKVRDWDDIENYNWDKLNSDIQKNKTIGCVVYGDNFPKSKLRINPDYHIHIKISKEKLIEKRREYIEKNPEKCKDMLLFLDNLKVIVNKLTYSHYIKNRDDSTINMWLDSDKNKIEEMYDQTFDYLMLSMKKFLNEYYSTHTNNHLNKEINKEKKIKKKYDYDNPDLEKSYMVAPGIDESFETDSSSDSSDDNPIYLGTSYLD
jgi:uridine kinase